MTKLSVSRARERQQASPDRIDLHAEAIARTLPKAPRAKRNPTPGERRAHDAAVAAHAAVIREFIRAAKAAVAGYLELMPAGAPVRRPHRTAAKQKHHSKAQRPADSVRHGLVGDIYEAYMSVRGDDPDVRGFKNAADAVLAAAGLRRLSEHEQTYLHRQIKTFTAAI